MDNYFNKNKEVFENNQHLNNIRNPEYNINNTIKIQQETDAQGLIPITHTYNENGQLFHRAYTFTRDELKEFIIKNRDSKILVDSVTPSDVPFKSTGVDVNKLNNSIYNNNNNNNYNANFEPINCFQASFNLKYNTPEDFNFKSYHNKTIETLNNNNIVSNKLNINDYKGEFNECTDNI